MLDFSENSVLKVYHGGAIHLIPVKSIRTVQIDGEQTMSYDGDFFISATITLQDGTRKIASGGSDANLCFISINNSIAGKAADGVFTIPISEVTSLEVH